MTDQRHGRVITPKTRGLVATELGVIGDWQNNEMEGGKAFPTVEIAGLAYTEDQPSDAIPEDGFILSGGHKDARDIVNCTSAEVREKLSKPDFSWPRISVSGGQKLDVQWHYEMPHVTRGYNWWITRNGWNPQQRVTRAQLEDAPFMKEHYTFEPFHQHKEKMVAKTSHSVTLPMGKTGHHVLMVAWIIADTGKAFYQAWDVEFK